MEFLEEDFAQIEHLNQIIYNNLTHESWDCFDTALLLEQQKIFGKTWGTYDAQNPKNSKITQNVKDIRYNGMIVNIEILSDGYIYTFDVRNALWDGTYKITHSKNNNVEEDVPFADDEIIIKKGDTSNKLEVRLSGEYKDRMRICFHMNMSGDGRNINETDTSIYLENPVEYTHQYDETVTEKGYVYFSKNKKPCSGANISITPCDSQGLPINKGIPQKSGIITGKNGSFAMPYGEVDSPGHYYVILKASYTKLGVTASTQQIVHIQKVQKNTRSIEWGDASNYKGIIKGRIHTYKIQCITKNEFGIHDVKLDKKLEGTYVNVSFIRATGSSTTYTCPIEKDTDGTYCIKPRINYRQYYEDYSHLNISIPASDGFPAYISQHKITHDWFVAENIDDVISELRKTDSIGEIGTDWIFLKPGTYSVTKPITLKRQITFAGLKGENPVTFTGNYKTSIISIENNTAASDYYMNVNLIGIKFMEAVAAIRLETGCDLLIDKCFFTHNTNAKGNYKGCSIFMPVDDKSIKNHDLWKVEIRNSTFYDNKGNEIQSIGKTYIHNNLFKTDHYSYLQQPEVKVVNVRAGAVKYEYNKSYINIGSKPMPTNHSFAKALTFIEKGATFNGKGPSQLGKDMSLPLYGHPYYNQAYTYAIYYYPYDDVRTKIVCSPRRGYERQATGHASRFKRWVYYDGYNFVRWNNGRNKGNTHDPWTKKELELPKNQGIYDLTNDVFEKGYDPRMSQNILNLS